MIFCVLVPCHTPGIIFLNLLKMRYRKKKETIWLVEVLAQINSLSGGIFWLCVFTSAGEQLHMFLRCCSKMTKP